MQTHPFSVDISEALPYNRMTEEDPPIRDPHDVMRWTVRLCEPRGLGERYEGYLGTLAWVAPSYYPSGWRLMHMAPVRGRTLDPPGLFANVQDAIDWTTATLESIFASASLDNIKLVVRDTMLA